MPGGLEGRMNRERVKAMQLQNAQAAMDLGSISQLIQQAAGLQQMEGDHMDRRMRQQEMDMREQDSHRQNRYQNRALQQQGEYQNRQLESDYRQRQGDMLGSLNETYDMQPQLEAYLKSLGIDGSLTPRPQVDFGFGGGEAAAPAQTPEQIEAMNLLMNQLRKMEGR